MIGIGIPITIAVLVGILLLTSYVERMYAEMGKFLSREFQENIDVYERRVEPKLGMARERVSTSVSVLTQLTTAALGIVSAYAVLHDTDSHPREMLTAGIGLLLIIVIFNRLLPFILFTRTKGQWLVRLTWILRLLVYLALVITIPLGFGESVASLSREQASEEPERPSEAVEALIEAGQEEGILQEVEARALNRTSSEMPSIPKGCPAAAKRSPTTGKVPLTWPCV